MIIKTYEDLYNWYVVIEKDYENSCYANFYSVQYWGERDGGTSMTFEHKNDNGEYTDNIEEALRKAGLSVHVTDVWYEEFHTADCDCFYLDEISELLEIVEKVREICRAEIIKTYPYAATC